MGLLTWAASIAFCSPVAPYWSPSPVQVSQINVALFWFRYLLYKNTTTTTTKKTRKLLCTPPTDYLDFDSHDTFCSSTLLYMLLKSNLYCIIKKYKSLSHWEQLISLSSFLLLDLYWKNKFHALRHNFTLCLNICLLTECNCPFHHFLGVCVGRSSLPAPQNWEGFDML